MKYFNSDTDAITIANSGKRLVSVRRRCSNFSDARLLYLLHFLVLLIDGKSYEKDGAEIEATRDWKRGACKEMTKMLAVNNQGLVPVLINALKDQQNEIDELKEMVQAIISRK